MSTSSLTVKESHTRTSAPVMPSSADQYSVPPLAARLLGALPSTPGFRSTTRKGVRTMEGAILMAHTSRPVEPLFATHAIIVELTTVREAGVEDAVHVLISASSTGEAVVGAASCAVKRREYSSTPSKYPMLADSSSVSFRAGCTARPVGPKAEAAFLLPG